MSSPVTGDYFISSTVSASHDYRIEDTLLSYALNELFHILIVLDLKGVILEIMEKLQIYILNLV